MTITIRPFTIDLNDRPISPLLRCDKDGYLSSVVYWGIYLNDEQISYTSTKELAEQTKMWMERWLEIEIQQSQRFNGCIKEDCLIDTFAG
ncbi:MAG: hypothetical protein ACREOB_08965 [Thermodesulfobacteriota bacterium]